jgi:hypothetical protein
MATPTQDELNEDWIKTLAWDLGFTDLAGLWAYCGTGSNGDRVALERFMDLPAWRAAPDQLRQEAASWLAGH